MTKTKPAYSTQTFDQFCQKVISRVETALAHHLSSEDPSLMPLYMAMQYSTLSKSKRIRALFVFATGQALGVSDERLEIAACAIELVHCFSLVHDDLPAMDNATLRRGKPTCHLAFNETTAILAGDALLALAFELLSQPLLGKTNPSIQLKMIQVLSRAIGAQGMTGGQHLDMAIKDSSFTYPDLITLHSLKTGRLIEASVMFGFLLSPEVSNHALELALMSYANHIGLAFQIKDDLLDVESSDDILGKDTDQDKTLNKQNFVSMIGIEATKESLSTHHQKAIEALKHLDGKANQLQALADFVCFRKL